MAVITSSVSYRSNFQTQDILIIFAFRLDVLWKNVMNNIIKKLKLISLGKRYG